MWREPGFRGRVFSLPGQNLGEYGHSVDDEIQSCGGDSRESHTQEDRPELYACPGNDTRSNSFKRQQLKVLKLTTYCHHWA